MAACESMCRCLPADGCLMMQRDVEFTDSLKTVSYDLKVIDPFGFRFIGLLKHIEIVLKPFILKSNWVIALTEAVFIFMICSCLSE